MRVDVICVADRPERLPLLVWSLHAQTHRDWSLSVLDQSADHGVARYLEDLPPDLQARISYVPIMREGDWGQSAKEGAAQQSTADALMFPADDAYYVPSALEQFTHALERGADVVLCGWLYDLFGYAPMPPTPAVGLVDVGGFMVRRETFLQHGWPSKQQTGDGELVLGLLNSGARLGKVYSVLYVKS